MPQIVVRLVMARTMVEGGYSVKTAVFKPPNQCS
jgi:hypothetical protein